MSQPSSIRIVAIPQVCITLRAFQKLRLYIHQCSFEICGLGTVDVRSPNEVWVTDVFALPQEVTGASTSLEEGTLAQFIIDAVGDGTLERIKCSWHSHVGFGSYFSFTDRETIEQFASADFFISIVGNKHDEFLCRLDIFNPMRVSVELPLKCPEYEALWREVRNDIDSKVRPLIAHGRQRVQRCSRKVMM